MSKEFYPRLDEEEDEEDNEKAKSGKDESFYFAERLIKARKIIISDVINAKLASKVINQLLIMESDDPKKNITLYINSPGGEIFSGFAVFDIIRFIKPRVKTVITGLAASMGSIIALSAKKNDRFILTNAKVLITDSPKRYDDGVSLSMGKTLISSHTEVKEIK